MTELVRYEAARRALAEAVAVDEVAEIRSQAEAMRHYARQAGDKTLEIQSAQLRFRAERKLGELIVSQKETVGLNAGSRGQLRGKDNSGSAKSEQPEDERLRLADIGVDRKLSSKAQKLAALDAAAFEQALERHADEMRSGQGRVAMDLLKVDAEERGRVHRRDLAAALSFASVVAPDGRLYPALLADPPWRRKAGIGNRAYENHYPTMPWPEILDYLKRAGEALLPDSWAWMWIPRAHLLAKVPFKTEVVLSDGEVVLATVDLPLAYACQLALGMDSYSTCYVWTKTDEDHPDESGTGLLVWDQDELLLQFKRGRGLPKPATDEKFGSNHRERATDHSRKPEHYRNMVRAMVGRDSSGQPLPVLELFARVDDQHPLPEGWGAWGNQAGISLQAEISTPTDASESSSPAGEDLAELPSGETEAAAAEATSEWASTAAAVTEPPYSDGDVIVIDQPAGTDWLQPTQLDALELPELEQLRILADFCHPKRDAMQGVLGPIWQAREMAYESGGQWQLRAAGKARLRELIDAVGAPARFDLTEPYRAPQMSFFDVARQIDDAPPPELVDGALQTRLPIDDDELAEQIALLDIAAGRWGAVDGSMVRHLVGARGFAHCTADRVIVTDAGRAFLAQLVAPASLQQQGAST
ncbi:N6-adenosine-specific RNA methylase IME4 [Bradyrhizobium yuanmingense]|uniref:hypothetical protein n=1 Tax=Bradyrhizobium yuanmingense TaxID=108015 RepID=UPI0035194FF5